MYVEEEKTYPAYISKHNSRCEKIAILLMIPNEKELHCSKKKLPLLLRGIPSKHDDKCYCLNYFHPFRRNKEIRKWTHKNIKMYTKTDILSTVMPSEDTKILEFSQL